MASIVLVTSEMAGRVAAVCELARRLSVAGHTTTIASFFDLTNPATAVGAEFVMLPRRKANGRHPNTNTRGKAGMRVNEMDLDLMQSRLGDLTADLYVIDAELPIPIMVSESAGLPVATFTTMLSVWKRPGLPPLGTRVVAGEGILGSNLGIEAVWAWFRLTRRVSQLKSHMSRGGVDRMSLLKEVANRLGFDWDKTDASQWLRPVVFPNLQMLSLNAGELDFPHEPREGFRYSGPLIDPRRIEFATPSSKEDETRLSAIFDRRSSGRCEALIYCSFGAWHKGDDRRFLKAAMDGVAEQSSWEMILGLGNRVSSFDLGPIPSNVHLFEWAPQLKILERADVAIHHGGISSVNECILARVPMILYPFDFMDQPGNSARVEFHGLGEVGDRETEQGNDLALRVARVLDDPSYRRNLEGMAVSLERYLSENVAVAEIERLLSSF